ncbi:preprotein translocase subunit SecA [Terricaulis silvestris]|uniref:Protein translocase subunit SecA n=1 Tax=Terricaulis silvestris TaxID=2686094 RepID=A0A6I6MNZ1_9CAUL|nr:preprotein translocase subunit SecA [Terricaulis silvestris]QGZ96419.1 preprotein translocase subunit SecA [Terricaulis silvestris]
MLNLAKQIFGSVNERKTRQLRPLVAKINALEPTFEALSDEALRNKTSEYRHKLARGAKIEDILPEAFATVREASKRTLGMRHFDVQLMGGMFLHQGNIAEMRTGEGKTLVATLPTYLNALESRGVHVITVNDYLAKRDSEWMGQVYRFLGLSVGVIVHGLYDNERRQAYASDVTYGTNNEFGFDYLRDNMKYSLGEMVQRGHRFAIVDEVDSILIDEARTPLIISGPTEDRSEFYKSIDALMPLLRDEHFEHDEKQRSVTYTEAGSERIEEMLVERELLQGSLYEPANISLVHHANQALRAHKLFHKDKDYIVKDNEVILVDEFTGRMMHGRRLSEGLHQAIEAKEQVNIQPENQTLASITFQNYFRLYDKLGGMTGTASTEAAEFGDIYKLDVVEIPTNRPVKRTDIDDEVYRTAKEKYKAIIADIEETHKNQQPVLVGTVSIEKSETLSALLKQRGIPHQVLNARYHEQEASIVAQAGVPGSVTIATNMAGRGTDIQLGGNLDMRVKAALKGDETPDQIAVLKKQLAADIEAKRQVALSAGGLYVLGTERHESRRIDNQLRGRTGRQGDPGKSKFYICLEDDLLRIFAAERLDSIMRSLGIQEGEAIIHPWMNKALETSQRRVEQRNFEIRKNLLKFDDVINDQRKAIFEQRIEFMRTADVAPIIKDMRHDVVEKLVWRHMPEKAYPEQWNTPELMIEGEEIFGLAIPVDRWAAEEGIAQHEIIERLTREIDQAYAQKAAQLGPERLRAVEKQVLLSVVDMRWREHLSLLDHLRSVIHLRGYAQRDPLNEFKTEAFTLFERMLLDLRTTVTRMMLRLQIGQADEVAKTPLAPPKTYEIHQNPDTGENEMSRARDDVHPLAPDGFDRHNPNTWGKVSRNAPCPCGSGKKFKYCHGTQEAQSA